MTAYLGCMSSARGANARCREDARAYLECRMARNLMARDEMRNLGFWDEDGGKAGAAAAVEGGAAAAAREGGGRVDVAEGKDPTEPKSRGADAAGKGK
jgi:cytochrome c oxidase assembly protein subunit 19